MTLTNVTRGGGPRVYKDIGEFAKDFHIAASSGDTLAVFPAIAVIREESFGLSLEYSNISYFVNPTPSMQEAQRRSGSCIVVRYRGFPACGQRKTTRGKVYRLSRASD